jgi:hypothetical protein
MNVREHQSPAVADGARGDPSRVWKGMPYEDAV